MCFPLFLIIFFLLFFFLLFFFYSSMKLIGSESLSGREHFACGCGFPFQEGAFRMQLWISFPGGDISHAAVDSLSWGSISHAAVDFLSRRGHFACGCGFPFQEGHFACGCGFPFQREHFACGFSLPGGAFRMRQVRGGEAFIVAKAIVPSSRSSPPGHAAVLCCGMCYFSDGAMDSTMLDIVGCADISN